MEDRSQRIKAICVIVALALYMLGKAPSYVTSAFSHHDSPTTAEMADKEVSTSTAAKQ